MAKTLLKRAAARSLAQKVQAVIQAVESAPRLR
jgi:hypothetical protein